MPDKSIDKILEKFFSKSDKRDWEKVAILETNGENPFEFLSWHGKDDILFLPYYNAEDLTDQVYQTVNIPAAADNTRRLWANLPDVLVTDEVTANTLALHHLSSGADGICFDVRRAHQPDLLQLLKNVEWANCTVAFRVDANTALAHSLAHFIAKNQNADAIKGALFWESIPKNTNLGFYFEQCQYFRSLGLSIPAASPVVEISDALIKGVRAYEMFSGHFKAVEVFRRIAFSLAIDARLIESIAKLKALRALWYQVARAYGHDDYNQESLHIHARSERANDGPYGPHENMLKATFAAIAAITGGCSSLTIEADAQSQLVSRQARNISTILREESFLDQVSDPVAGAYAVESITNVIAKKAWEIFQLKWKQS
jgi:methylmalonyl-CoA mutase